MEEERAPPQQQTYPQQYPQQPYQYPYYYPPPKKDDSKLVTIIVIIIVIALVVPTILGVILYIWVIDLEPPVGPTIPTGTFASVDVKTCTEAWATFARISPEPRPTDLVIVLQNDTRSGTYRFPSDDGGTFLTLSDGSPMATITYKDYADNGRVNSGDELRMTALGRYSDFTLKLIWDTTGDQIAFINFHTC